MSDTEHMAEPKAEPVRRLEVFTGAGRRRAWTAEEKARIVAESDAGVESVSAVARRYGLTPQQLFGWRRRSRGSGPGPHAEGVAFAPVIVAAGCEEPARSRTVGEAAIEIAIGAATVRVPPGADLATLHTVLCAVRAAS
jgi:transposase